MKINQILDKIDENQLFVPDFQREYVWKKENAKDLIFSLIRDYPTGTMLTWETNNPPKLKGNWVYDERQGAVKIILDGQQRITTLYLLIKNNIPPYYKKHEILNDPRGLYINIDTLELMYHKPSIMDINPYWINITNIFQKKLRERDVINQLRDQGINLDRKQEDRVYDNFRAVESIPEKEFLEQSIPIKASLKEAIDIFYMVNSSGVNLTDAELALAQISGYWPEARDLFKEKLESLRENGFDFKLDFVVYCLLGILYNIGSDMSKLHSSNNRPKLQEAWKKLDEIILDYVVNLLRSQAYVDHSKEINSVYALIPIVVYVYRKGNHTLTQQDIKKIIKWFYYSQIRQRYVGQLPQKLDKDLGIISKSNNPFDEMLNGIKLERPLEIQADEFEGVGISNALFSMMRWYFKSKNAVCLTTGVGIRQNMGKKYTLEWDHIFPYSALKARGYNLNNRHKYALAQEITNRAILTKIANRRKSAQDAKNYLKGVQELYPLALKLQCIPEDESLWELDRFEDFIVARRNLLAKELNSFLNNITKTEETTMAVSIEDIINRGESNELEFKSSVRWNYRDEKVDKGLETVILKSISAFANGEGGTLLIGVDDEGEVLGLERDYESLQGNKDEFELHIRNLINQNFGKSFATSGLKIKFINISDKEICQIDIAKHNKPLFLEVNKNGQKTYKFYVRSGNTSQEMGIQDVSEYIRTRFT